MAKEKKDRGLYVRSGIISKPKRIKQQTSKEADIKSHLSAIKNEIRLDAIQSNEYFCKGCGHTGVLDCSHILSVGKYKHLELVKENIQLLCRHCHLIWESGSIDKQLNLHCFNDNLIFISNQDILAYNKFNTRVEDYLVI